MGVGSVCYAIILDSRESSGYVPGGYKAARIKACCKGMAVQMLPQEFPGHLVMLQRCVTRRMQMVCSCGLQIKGALQRGQQVDWWSWIQWTSSAKCVKMYQHMSIYIYMHVKMSSHHVPEFGFGICCDVPCLLFGMPKCLNSGHGPFRAGFGAGCWTPVLCWDVKTTGVHGYGWDREVMEWVEWFEWSIMKCLWMPSGYGRVRADEPSISSRAAAGAESARPNFGYNSEELLKKKQHVRLWLKVTAVKTLHQTNL